mgnify:CR=1 FL=1
MYFITCAFGGSWIAGPLLCTSTVKALNWRPDRSSKNCGPTRCTIVSTYQLCSYAFDLYVSSQCFFVNPKRSTNVVSLVIHPIQIHYPAKL